MRENKEEVKAIGDLLGKHFYIPSYQRGYRWTEQQIHDLLGDIATFGQQSLRGGERVSTASSPYGWDIRFTYSGKRFCWHRDDHVYPLKEGKWVEKAEQTDTSRYYCFDGTKCADRAEFLAKLDKYAQYAQYAE